MDTSCSSSTLWFVIKLGESVSENKFSCCCDGRSYRILANYQTSFVYKSTNLSQWAQTKVQ